MADPVEHGSPVFIVLNDAGDPVAQNTPVDGSEAGLVVRPIAEKGQKTMAASQSVAIASDQTSIPIEGDTANDEVDAGNPVKIGGIATISSFVPSVQHGDRVDAAFTKNGKQIVVLNTPRELTVQNHVTLTNTTQTTILTAIADIFLDVTLIIITAVGGDITVSFRDATNGTVRFSVSCLKKNTIIVDPTSPIIQTAVNNNWTVQLDSSSETRIFIQAVKNT
jgi:hypothetical protein